MSNEEVKNEIADLNEDALFVDGFDAALVGYSERCGMPTLAVYDSERCINLLQLRDNMTREDAVEFFEYNVLGSYMGENTPIFLTKLSNIR